MQALVIDVSFQKPDYKRVRQVGYIGVMRYLSKDPSKNISSSEVLEILGQGLALGLVWEAGATDWQDPKVAEEEATLAVAQARNVRYPEGCCIFAANDANSTLAQVAPGFIAARPTVKGAGYQLGVYAGDTVTDPLVREGVCDQGWQAAASSWGDGKVSSVASLFQRTSRTLPDCGGSYDENVLLKASAGLWIPPVQSVPPTGAGGGPALPPPAPSSPTAPPWPGRYLRYPPLLSGSDVRIWQLQMNRRGWRLSIDGVYGPVSRNICLAFQREKRLVPDGIVGPVTWVAAWVDPVTR